MTSHWVNRRWLDYLFLEFQIGPSRMPTFQMQVHSQLSRLDRTPRFYWIKQSWPTFWFKIDSTDRLPVYKLSLCVKPFFSFFVPNCKSTKFRSKSLHKCYMASTTNPVKQNASCYELRIYFLTFWKYFPSFSGSDFFSVRRIHVKVNKNCLIKLYVNTMFTSEDATSLNKRRAWGNFCKKIWFIL